jgi:hypothetical protein
MPATKVVVAIPWRAQPARLAAHAFVRRWYADVLPDAPVVEVDTEHQPYNLAAARNLGVRRAAALDADVVVVGDADVVIDRPHHLLEAIEAAAADGWMHMPFDDQLYLTADETAGLIDRAQAPQRRGHRGNGCCYVVQPDAYWAFGGSDERFSGWGGDDDQLVAAATTLVGLTRHDGVAWSLHHADECRDVGSERHRPNSQLAIRYWKAMGNERAMRALIAERPEARS